MYEYIKGQIEYVGPEYIVIDHRGIGYQVYSPNPFQFTKYEGTEVKVFIYQHVKEDILALYGFISREEKRLFIKLLDVSGIGPKGALAILASGQPEQVIRAIESEDEVFLVKFPGVGKKTARQIILDLKGKLQDIVPDYFPSLLQPGSLEQFTTGSKELEEALLALEALGYSSKELKKLTPSLQKESLSTDEYIKKGLQLMLK